MHPPRAGVTGQHRLVLISSEALFQRLGDENFGLPPLYRMSAWETVLLPKEEGLPTPLGVGR